MISGPASGVRPSAFASASSRVMLPTAWKVIGCFTAPTTLTGTLRYSATDTTPRGGQVSDLSLEHCAISGSISEGNFPATSIRSAQERQTAKCRRQQHGNCGSIPDNPQQKWKKVIWPNFLPGRLTSGIRRARRARDGIRVCACKGTWQTPRNKTKERMVNGGFLFYAHCKSLKNILSWRTSSEADDAWHN